MKTVNIFKFKAVGLLILSLTLYQCGENIGRQKKVLGLGEVFCDAEELNENGDKFLSYGTKFKGALGRTSDEAYEGEYSCALDTSNMYGMTYELDSLKPYEIFHISVYRKSSDSKGAIVAQSIQGGFYESVNFSYQKKDENGWDILSLKIQLPNNVDSLKGLKIYTFNGEKTGEKVYFDNLRIQRFVQEKSVSTEFKEGFVIELSDYDYSTLKNFRDQAISQKVITKNLKKEFKGFLKFKGKTYKIGIKFKGDWTDHLKGYKWSYRIMIKDGMSVMGLRTFSIQSPAVRDYLNEWVIHKICEKEDLLTTSFSYIPVAINGLDFGLYNIEEHFEKQLVESRKRREGVILKFDEEGFWEANLHHLRTNKYPTIPFYEASTIAPFKKKKLKKSAKLFNQFLIAQNLMLKYKQGNEDLNNYLDLENIAKAYALMDLGNVKHSFAWHNQRFYYNPITSKLELIVYDCYSGTGDAMRRDYSIEGDELEGSHITSSVEYCIKSVLDNPLFQTAYLKYLKKFSSKKYVENTLEHLESNIDSLSSIFKLENEAYNYDYSFLKSNAENIRASLVAYEQKVKNHSINYKLTEDVQNKYTSEAPFKSVSLKVYLESLKSNGSVALSLKNYHCKAITIVGYSTKQFPDSILNVSKKFTLGSFPGDKKTYNLSLKEKPKKLFYKVVGDLRDTIFSSKVIPWPIPTTEIAYAEMAKPLQVNTKEYVLEGKLITFKKGKHVVKENIVIPSGMTVVFEAGVELVFNNERFLLSYSAVKMIGIQQEPIKISSTDGTGGGFTVLEAENESYLRNVVFDGLNTFNQSGWSLTGAVTFYESKVNIDSTIFTNNKCEDGLNIIRSTFSLSNSEISNTFSDGFDADFCEGIVYNCIFNKAGNDCLDFSGSTIEVKNTQLNASGDKGISCGEQSQVKIHNVFINGAVLGIASKDNSIVDVRKIKLMNCKTGFSIFQKKSEYGPASIFVDGYELIGVEVLSDVESGSNLELKNKIENPSTLEGYIKKIKSDKKWMESIKIKAKKRNVSIEEMVEIDAKHLRIKKNRSL